MKQIAALVICIAAAWTLWPSRAYPHNPTTTTVLFNREIATLLQRKCVQCHARGAMAMPLVTYADARPWAEAIKEEALARRMPPWPAERGYGAFSNDIGLTPREFEFLLSWVDGGVPQGDGDPPAFVDHGAHWMLGNPDLTLTPRASARIEARSAPAFRRLLIDTGLARDTWVRAIDFKPGDARVVRAAFFSIANASTYLGGWTPWQSSTQLPTGVAIKLPPSAQIAVDVLYAGTVETITDTPTLALYIVPSPPAFALSTTVLRPTARIPPFQPLPPLPPSPLRGELRLDAATALTSLKVEMQNGGRSLEIKVRRPDGSRDVLLWVKDFRQDWQTPYVLRQPAILSAGSVIEATAYFDAPSVGSASTSRTADAVGAVVAPFTVTLNHYAARAAR